MDGKRIGGINLIIPRDVCASTHIGVILAIFVKVSRGDIVDYLSINDVEGSVAVDVAIQFLTLASKVTRRISATIDACTGGIDD